MRRSLYVAAYDVRDPNRLRRALRVLRDYSCGGQYSLGECWLSDRERNELIQRMKDTVLASEDRFDIWPLDPRAAVQTLGVAEQPADPELLILN